MPMHQFATSIGAGAVNDNLVANTPVQFIERPSAVRIYITAEAAGESRLQVSIGSRLVMVESPVSRQNRPPLVPDDLLIQDVAMPGEMLTLRGRNTGAGANTIFGRVEVMPFA